VSVNIAEQAGQMFLRSRDFLASWHKDLRTAIAALTAQVDAYEEIDRQNVSRA
jgi:hypothetical protein